jgi:poly(A) polymerase
VLSAFSPCVRAHRNPEEPTIRIDTPWQDDPAFTAVVAAISAAGGQVRVVGGAVRDCLLQRPVGDIDMATSLLPEAVMAAAAAAGLKSIPTGIEHGTITVIAGGRPFEITTLRADVETDGRRAVVSFTTDWARDAMRRDFTINALYLDPDGALHDPLGQGRADLKAQVIRFIGSASERIREDYLRILRFFRFHAMLGWPIRDRSGAEACAAHLGGLQRLSVERIWLEMGKLLAAPDPAPMLAEMADTGILAAIAAELDLARGLPVTRDAILRLAAMIPDQAAASAISGRWKLPKADARRLVLAVRHPADSLTSPAATRIALYHDGRQAMMDRSVLATARGEVVDRDVQALIADWPIPAFPLRGRDLMTANVRPGPEMGELLHRLEARWIADDFRADRAQCLAWLAEEVRDLADPGSTPPTG